MKRILWALVVMAVVGTACGPQEEQGLDPVTGEGIAQTRQSLAVDDLYNKLREMEGMIPVAAQSATLNVGTLSSSGVFSGLSTTYIIDPYTRKPRAMTPMATISGINLIAVFNAPGSGIMSVTANGKTVTSYTGSVSIDLGVADSVDWSMQAFGITRSDRFSVSRAGVVGLGAFTLSALPISIVYEPPMNAARTNAASVGFRQEMTTVTTVSNGTASTAAPKWATGVVMGDIFNRLANNWSLANTVRQGISVCKTMIGSVDSSTTSGTTVNTDSTLGVSQVNAQTITTNAKLGPGRGDLIVFYKNARVAWAMDNGKVALTLLDHGPLAIITVDALKNDLSAVKAGYPAAVTGLDAVTLEALIALDPQASLKSSPIIYGSDSVTLPTSRFTKDPTIILSGSNFNNSVSHTITTTDTRSTTSTRTTVKNYHPGWLSVIGIGQTQAGTFTSTVTLSSARSQTVSSTLSADFFLSASASESYSVEVNYDNIFGSFLTRLPPSPPLVFESFR